MIMVVPFKFKSFGQSEKGYMGHTSYELSVVSASSPWSVCFLDSPALQVEIGISPLPPKSFWKVFCSVAMKGIVVGRVLIYPCAY